MVATTYPTDPNYDGSEAEHRMGHDCKDGAEWFFRGKSVGEYCPFCGEKFDLSGGV